ncbi:MAG: DNA mismatch repair endonuclease MutL [Spirochaetales bacterium]|nr:DNA mismatch repair endonuclease MutL [Spirochaetales bacterium]MCF7939074.1 DNA mismatch repair endonuclease MutL [Spirochaetales bacterium]
MNKANSLDENKREGSIQVLPDQVARKIAAGEVIERPSSVIRELLDNAIDAGATSIEVTIEQGGIGLIRVSDNGAGMSESDLKQCLLPHATSKIRSTEDLLKVKSMGFRGEALSSIAAVASMSITSRPGENHSGAEQDHAGKITVHHGKQRELERVQGAPGTTVEVRGLFADLPARKRFLKSPSAESTQCRRVFLEKAVAFPGRTFRFTTEGSGRTMLPPVRQVDRIISAYPRIGSRNFFDTIEGSEGPAGYQLVLGGPETARRDRRYLHVYVNKRKIQDYSLMQAIEYGYRTILPGGSFPTAFLFLEIEPDLVDFNIHPAKREARIRIARDIHHLVTTSVQSHFGAGLDHKGQYRKEGGQEQLLGEPERNLRPERDRAEQFSRLVTEEARRNPAGKPEPENRNETPAQSSNRDTGSFESSSGEQPAPFRYIGQTMGIFLIAEKDDSIFIIDQHAAHERILYDRFRSASHRRQTLLVPTQIKKEDMIVEPGEDLLHRLNDMGVCVESEKSGDGLLITALPDFAAGRETAVTDFLRNFSGSTENLQREFYADLACKAAIKEGEILQAEDAASLVAGAFGLTEPRCPHGRPVWHRIDRETLFELVGRT